MQRFILLVCLFCATFTNTSFADSSDGYRGLLAERGASKLFLDYLKLDYNYQKEPNQSRKDALGQKIWNKFGELDAYLKAARDTNRLKDVFAQERTNFKTEINFLNGINQDLYKKLTSTVLLENYTQDALTNNNIPSQRIDSWDYTTAARRDETRAVLKALEEKLHIVESRLALTPENSKSTLLILKAKILYLIRMHSTKLQLIQSTNIEGAVIEMFVNEPTFYTITGDVQNHIAFNPPKSMRMEKAHRVENVLLQANALPKHDVNAIPTPPTPNVIRDN